MAISRQLWGLIVSTLTGRYRLNMDMTKTKMIVLSLFLVGAFGCDPMRRVTIVTGATGLDTTQVLAVSSNRTALLEAMQKIATKRGLTSRNPPTNYVGNVIAAYTDAKHSLRLEVTVSEYDQTHQYKVEIFEMGPVFRSKLSKSIEEDIRKALPDLMWEQHGE